MSAVYSVRYVHKIALKPSDVGPDVGLLDMAFADRNSLARELRETGVMRSGARIREMRIEGDKVLVFPTLPGSTTYWHCIVLTTLERGDAIPEFRNLSHNDLMKFWARYNRPSRRDAERLLGGWVKGGRAICQSLACYASNLATVLSCKQSGDLAAAAIYQHHVDLCLERIPEQFRPKASQS